MDPFPGNVPLGQNGESLSLSLNFVRDQENSSYSSKPCWVKMVLNSCLAFLLVLLPPCPSCFMGSLQDVVQISIFSHGGEVGRVCWCFSHTIGQGARPDLEALWGQLLGAQVLLQGVLHLPGLQQLLQRQPTRFCAKKFSTVLDIYSLFNMGYFLVSTGLGCENLVTHSRWRYVGHCFAFIANICPGGNTLMLYCSTFCRIYI